MKTKRMMKLVCGIVLLFLAVVPGRLQAQISGPYAYLNSGSAVSVLDTSTNTVVATIPLSGGGAAGLAVNSATGTTVYAETVAGVSIIDATTNSFVAAVPLNIYFPGGIATTPDGMKAFATTWTPSSSGSGFNTTLTCINNFAYVVEEIQTAGSNTETTTTYNLAATIPVGQCPFAVTVNPNGKTAYVANNFDNTLSVIDVSTNSVVATVPAGQAPNAIAVNPAGTMIYVTNWAYDDSGNATNGTVSVLDASTYAIVATIQVGVEPSAIAVSPDGRTVYVLNTGPDNVNETVTFSDTTLDNVFATVPVATEYSMAMTPDGTKLYLAGSPITSVGISSLYVTTLQNPTGTSAIAMGPTPLTITTSAGPNGTISPSIASAIFGTSKTFTITPAAGYYVQSLSGCGGTFNQSATYQITVPYTYTTAGITSDCTITALFSPALYTVNTSFSGGGTIQPPQVSNISYGTTLSFTVTPSTGYVISSVTGCGGTLSGNTYTTAPITNPCSVTAVFTLLAFTVTPSPGPNGSMGPSTPQTVSYGSATGFDIDPAFGYQASVTGCGGTVTWTDCPATASPNTCNLGYETGPITASCTVSATFTGVTFTVSTSAGANGTISPSAPQTLTYPAMASFTVTPNPGYTISTVTGCDGTLTGNTYTTTTATNCTVFASFAATGPPPAHGAYAYIVDYLSNLVSVIDTSTNTLVTTIPVGNGPGGIAVNPSGTRIYVANSYLDNSVSVIDTSTNAVISTVKVGTQPEGITVINTGTLVYVANEGDNTVSDIQTQTSPNTVLATIPVGKGPMGIAASPNGLRVYVANLGDNTVSVIQTATDTVMATVPVGTFPVSVAAAPDGTKMYVVNDADSTVSVIDMSNTVVATIPVGTWPGAIAVNPSGTRVYVASSSDNTVSIIDTSSNAVVATVPVGKGPGGIAFNPAGTMAYVTNGSDNTVSVIDTSANAVVATFAVPQGPGSIVIVGPNNAATTTTINAPAITYGANGSVTVTVSSTAGTPTGNVSLTVDGGSAITEPLSSGSATFTLTSLTAGNHSLSASYAAQGNYAASSATGTLQVNQATPTISWATPASITYGTGLSATQLNATANVPGTFLYTPAAGTLLSAGNQTLTVTFTPSDATDYTTTTATVTLVVKSSNGTASTPVFSPMPSTYNSPLTVTISEQTSGTTVYYTLDGSTPSANSAVYAGPLKLTGTATIKAMASGGGYGPSAVATASYTLLALTPSFSPLPSTYSPPRTVTISDGTAGTTIYYTTDGSTPTGASTPYTGPISVSQTETINAIAIGTGMNPSAVATGTYTMQALTPGFSPLPSTYSPPKTVTISEGTAGATIYYTTDGSTPSATNGAVYSGPIKLTQSTTISAVAIGNGMNSSSVATATYTMQALTPGFSPLPSTYSTAQNVTISEGTAGTTIYYTLDGSTPSATNGAVYSGPIKLTATTTINAIAVGNGAGLTPSAVATATYTIN